MRKLFAICIALTIMCINSAIANQGSVDMADELRSNGKIYVVVLVLATIFAGIIAYLVRLDRKISKIEKNKHS